MRDASRVHRSSSPPCASAFRGYVDTRIYAVAQRHAAWHSFFGHPRCVTLVRPFGLATPTLYDVSSTVWLVAASSPREARDSGLFSPRYLWSTYASDPQSLLLRYSVRRVARKRLLAFGNGIVGS